MKKKLSFILVLCMSATLLPGCAILKPTPEKILSRTNNVLAKTEDLSGQVEMNMDISTEMDDASVSMGFNLEGDLEYSKEDEIAHLDGIMDVEAFGVNQSFDFENYTTPKASYTFMEDNWTKTEEKSDFDNFGLNIDLIKDSLKLDENTVTENKKECYKFTGEIAFKDIAESLQTLDFEDLLEEVDEDEEVEYELFINKKTFEPVKQTVSFELDLDEAGTELKYTIIFDKFNSGLDLKLPKKAKKATVTDSVNDVLESDDEITDDFNDFEDGELIFNGNSENEIDETNANSSKDVTLIDFDGNNYASIKASDFYYFDSIQDWGCEVFVTGNEYSVAYIDGYDDSVDTAIEDRETYIEESSEYMTLQDKEKLTASNGTDYMLFTTSDTSGDLTYYAILGTNTHSVEINVSDYFVKEANLEVTKVIDDLVCSVKTK